MARHSSRVLVVEDDGVIRSALEATLRGEGYQVRAEFTRTEYVMLAQHDGPGLSKTQLLTKVSRLTAPTPSRFA